VGFDSVVELIIHNFARINQSQHEQNHVRHHRTRSHAYYQQQSPSVNPQLIMHQEQQHQQIEERDLSEVLPSFSYYQVQFHDITNHNNDGSEPLMLQQQVKPFNGADPFFGYSSNNFTLAPNTSRSNSVYN
jgi:hypothetical protein